MAKKAAGRKTRVKPSAGGRIVLRTGEALVEAEPAWSAAEPEVVIGELDGPVGYAIANLLGDQTKGHSRVFAILNSDVQVRPATLMVSKVTVKSEKYTNILMGTVQAAIAHGVLDAVRAGDNPGEHTILFGLDGESLSVNVRATNRDCYARGALAAAAFLVGKPAGLYSMRDVLGLA